MIKTQIIGHLGHDNKLFDRTCAQCGGIFARSAPLNCSKCNRELVPIVTKTGKAMMVSEGTIYPEMTEKQKDAEVSVRSRRRNSMEITYRFVLLSFANSETGIVTEPPVHKYLTRGRQIMIEVNHIPVISWFKANDGSVKCEMRFGILTNEGDYVKLLGKKEVIDDMFVVPDEVAAKAQAIITPPVMPDNAQALPDKGLASELASLKEQLNALIAKNQVQPITEKRDVEVVIESDVASSNDVSIF